MQKNELSFRFHKLNAHAHSSASDGSLDIEEIRDVAREWGGIIAVTDHNTASAHERLESPHILPGIEVKVRDEDEGVDILLYHTRKELLALCEEVIYPARDPGNALYAPTSLEIMNLLSIAHERGCDIVIPHYAHVEGIAALAGSTQREIAKRFPVIMEWNGRMGKAANLRAKYFALRWKLPLIAAGDSHLASQHTGTYTTIPLPEDVAPNSRNLFESVRKRPRQCRRRVEDAGMLDTLRTALQVLWAIGPGVITDYVRRSVRQSWRRDDAPELHERTPHTADEDDADGS